MLSTKKYSHHLISEVFYWVGMLRTRSPGDSISVALRKPLQGGGRGSQAVYKFATKGVGGLHSEDQISVKELRILGKGRCTLWAHRIHPFKCTSAVWGQACFLVHLQERWRSWMADSCILPGPLQSPWGWWIEILPVSWPRQ